LIAHIGAHGGRPRWLGDGREDGVQRGEEIGYHSADYASAGPEHAGFWRSIPVQKQQVAGKKIAPPGRRHSYWIKSALLDLGFLDQVFAISGNLFLGQGFCNLAFNFFQRW
jgi:hypothetical protein